MNRNLFARLAEGFPADRRAPALTCPDGSDVSFADLLEQTGRIATLLKASGVAPGDRVAARVEKSPAAIALYLASLQCGGVFAPLGPEAAAEAIGAIGARVIVCDPAAEPGLAAAASAARAALYTLDSTGGGRLTGEARTLPSDRSVAPRAGADAALILQDGSGEALRHDALWSDVASLHWLWGFRAGDALVHAQPLHGAEGLLATLNPMLLNGGRIILSQNADAVSVLAALPRASAFVGTPAQYDDLLAQPGLTREACAGTRVFAATAPLPEAAAGAFAARTGREVLDRGAAPQAGAAA